MHHKVREPLVAQRTKLLRAAQPSGRDRDHRCTGTEQCPCSGGSHHGRQRHDHGDRTLGAVACCARLNELDNEIRQSDQAIMTLAKADETARRLMSTPGIGPVTASALVASIRISPRSQARVSSRPSLG